MPSSFPGTGTISQILHDGSELGTVEFCRNYGRIRHSRCYWSSVKRNSRVFLPLNWFYFLPTAAIANPQPHLALGIFLLEAAWGIVPVFDLGVHLEHLKWLLLLLQMAVPAPNKEGHGGFWLYSAISGRNPLQIVWWSILDCADLGNFYKVKSTINWFMVWAFSAFLIVPLKGFCRT